MLFFRRLDAPSMLRYLWWRLVGRRGAVTVRLRGGPRVALRSSDAGNNDYGVAYEIFVHGFYDPPADAPPPLGAPDDVKLIVDLGANVGMSCCYWLTAYKAARLIAVEPHPLHAAQCRANLALNDGLGRTELHQAAAAAASGRMAMSDEGTSSRLLSEGVSERAAATIHQVATIDVLALLQGKRIDILKIDIEGGEYAIMEDDRFAMLDVAAIVMEWHQCHAERDDYVWCVRRLSDCGFRIRDIFKAPDHGMFWAFRGPAEPPASNPTAEAGAAALASQP